MVDPAASKSNILVDWTLTVYPIQKDNWNEWWKHTLLSNYHPYGEWLSFHSADAEPKFWVGIERLDGR